MPAQEMRGTKTIIERMDEADRIKETDRMLQDFNKGFVAGLQEAMRLLALEESIDFGPGRILKRIEGVKGETMITNPNKELNHKAVEDLRAWCKTDDRNPPIEEICDTIEAYDNLRAKLQQFEVKAAGMRAALVHAKTFCKIYSAGIVTLSQGDFEELREFVEQGLFTDQALAGPTDTDRIIYIAKVKQIETDTFSLRIGMSQELQKDAVGAVRAKIDQHMKDTTTTEQL